MVAIRRHAARALQFTFGVLFAVCAHAADSALHAAVEKGDRAQVERLLQAGADVNARTDTGETVLHYAAFPKDAWFAAALLKAGADPRAANSAGETPLFWAALEGNVPVARALLAAHADANAADAKGNSKDARRVTSPPRAATARSPSYWKAPISSS